MQGPFLKFLLKRFFIVGVVIILAFFSSDAGAQDPMVEGTLWVDRGAGYFVITLGRDNGVRAGTRLTVYEKGNKVGRVVIDKTFRKVSYVYPVKEALNYFSRDYYDVALEEN